MSEVLSRSAAKSAAVFDQISRKSRSKIFQLEGTLDEDLIRSSWSALGLYVSRQLRMGRGVNIPKLGIFTFSAPEVTLNGVTNPIERDKRLRVPVFIVSKEFVKGKDIKSGIGNELSGIRPYSVFGTNGIIQQAKANYSEMGSYAGLSKDDVKVGLDRIIRELSDRAKNNSSVEMEIPNVGVFVVRNNVCGVLFNNFLIKNTKGITQKPLDERVQKGEMGLTSESLRRFDLLESLSRKYQDKDNNFLIIEPNAKDYLKKNLNIDLSDIEKLAQRPQTAYTTKSKVSFKSPPLAENWMEADVRSSHSQIRPQTAQSTFYSQADVGLKKLEYWIRRNELDTEDAFIELCNSGLGACVPTSRLSQDELYNALREKGILLEPIQVTHLFNYLDVNKDGYIDIKDWSRVIKETGNNLQHIKDVIFRNKLKTDDVLKRMNLTREQGSIALMALKDALRSLDVHLNDIKAYKLAHSIMKGRELIPVKELIELLECYEEEGKIYDINWFNNILIQLKLKLASLDDPEILRKEFENYDDRNQGILDVANFKTCFMKIKLDLSVTEINRLSRYIDKNADGTIDYYKFLDALKKINKNIKQEENFKDLEDFTNRLSNYMNQNKVSSTLLIKKALGNYIKDENSITRITSDYLSSYLQTNVFPHSYYDEICKYIKRADIDNDGFIDSQDLETFLQRQKYLEIRHPLSARPSSILQPSLFPKEPLDEGKADIVIRDLRQTLFLKKISFFEFFKILDSNNDGFITIEEFSSGLDKVIKFSQMIKEGFFSFMDKQKIGMIDYKAFLQTMNKSIFTKQAEVTEDNWSWQIFTINKIREWYKSEGIALYDAFRLVDKDFDGFINKNDLKNFLSEVLHYQETELTPTRLDRLFKMIDQFKRGCVQFLDFKRVIDMEPELLNQTISGNKSPEKSFDWITNCKQQVGLVLSRQFSSLKSSFEEISEHQKRLLYTQFQKWLENSRALTGFNLTDKLIQQVFSDLDPHKKGYLTENDWLNAFGGYNWSSQMFTELKETILTQFSDISAAWRFFTKNSGISEIPFENFKEAIESLFPGRFTLSDCFSLYTKVKGDSDGIDMNCFLRSFGGGRVKSIGNDGKSIRSRISSGLNDETSRIVLEKVRQILRSANKSLKELFCEFDHDGSGTISNVEFRNAFRDLNLGLSLEEIDVLQNLCDENQDGLINYSEFVKKFNLGPSGERILERSKLRLQKIREDIYSYMISPKDAFRQFNVDCTGKMSFEQFTNLIVRLCQLSGTEMIPYPIIHDLFSFIDIRKDGVIDLNEWMQTFKMMDKHLSQRPKTTDALRQTLISTASLQAMQATKPISFAKQLRASNSAISPPAMLTSLLDGSRWENTKQYDEIIRTIAKNRKHLLDVFGGLAKKQKIEFNVAKEVIGEILRGVGIYVPEEFWGYLIKFGERDGVVDYKFMLDVYKERVSRMDSHPRIIQQ